MLPFVVYKNTTPRLLFMAPPKLNRGSWRYICLKMFPTASKWKDVLHTAEVSDFEVTLRSSMS